MLGPNQNLASRFENGCDFIHPAKEDSGVELIGDAILPKRYISQHIQCGGKTFTGLDMAETVGI
jgi:hypothetical protein